MQSESSNSQWYRRLGDRGGGVLLLWLPPFRPLFLGGEGGRKEKQSQQVIDEVNILIQFKVDLATATKIILITLVYLKSKNKKVLLQNGSEQNVVIPYAGSCTHFLRSFPVFLSKHNPYLTSTNYCMVQLLLCFSSIFSITVLHKSKASWLPKKKKGTKLKIIMLTFS